MWLFDHSWKAGHTVEPSGLPCLCSSRPLTALAHLLCLFYSLIIASASLSKSPHGLSYGPGQPGLSCPAAATHLCQPLCHSWCLIRPSSLCQFCRLLLTYASQLLRRRLLPSTLQHSCFLPLVAAVGLAARARTHPHAGKTKPQGKLGPTTPTWIFPLTIWICHQHVIFPGVPSWFSTFSLRILSPLPPQGEHPPLSCSRNVTASCSMVSSHHHL